jgi:hypothetical protein
LLSLAFPDAREEEKAAAEERLYLREEEKGGVLLRSFSRSPPRLGCFLIANKAFLLLLPSPPSSPSLPTLSAISLTKAPRSTGVTSSEVAMIS